MAVVLPKIMTSEEVQRLVMGDKLIASPETIEHKEEQAKKQSVTISIIKIIALFISIISASVSSYYSVLWFSSKQPMVLAVIVSMVIVACLTLGPELAILLFKKKGWNILGGLCVLVITAVCSLFSMVSTIGGLYDARTSRLSASVSVLAQESGVLIELSSLEEENARTQTSIEKYAKDETMYQRVLDGIEDPMSKQAQDIIKKRDASRLALTVANKKLEAATKRIVELSKNESVQSARRDNFYLFLSERLGSSEDGVEFTLSAFPAIFFDILAPAMLYVALAL